MQNVQGQNQQETFFGYDWAIVREIDRINRKEMGETGLDQRVHKLWAMAQKYLDEQDKDKWNEEYRNVDAETRKGKRWKQLAALIELFSDNNVFEEVGVDEGYIDFEEIEL